jgi:uncharacterized protein YceK
VPAPYAGVAFDVLVVADDGLILLLDLPFSLILDTAVLPLTLTTWLFRQVPPGSALRDD